MMTLDDLVPPSVRSAVASAGLHKIAGAMSGISEMGLKEAVTVIGMKAWLRRKEARAIADGIAAYGTLIGEKIAENPALTALLRRSVMPALGGAAIAAVPHFLSNDPNQGSPLPAMSIGALLGGAGGAIRDVGALPGRLNQNVADALRGMP
jgi:hypothetical protein